MERLEAKELQELKTLIEDYKTAKMKIADLEMAKHETIHHIWFIKDELTKKEAEFTSKYGKDSTINLETGVINGEDK